LLTEEEIRRLSPQDLEVYRHYLAYEQALQSPLDLACWLSPETVRTPHLEYINERLVALFEYRLYASGPGPEAAWFYRTSDGGPAHPALGIDHIPLDDPQLFEFWGEHPDTGEHVQFKLGIAVPPRHGKSWIVTEHLPLWIWLRYPDYDIAFATYSDDFAQFWGKRLRDRICEHEGKLGFALKNGPRHNAQHFEFNEIAGNMYLVGTGGALTGKGFQVGIIDDPIKDNVDAMSKTIRNTAADWYESVFDRRQTKKPGVIPVQIMMFTRWHEDDLAGRFIYDERKEVRPTWHMIRLQALAGDDDPLGREPGQALWPRQMSAAELLTLQSESAMWFGAMYQGWPTMGDKGLFGRWKTYEAKDGIFTWWEDGDVKTIREDECIRFAVVDTAYTKNTWSDYSVFSVWDYHRGVQRGFLRHVDRVRVESTELSEWMRNNDRRWNPSFIGVEDVASGKALLQEIRKDASLTIRYLQPEKDKVARAMGYAQAAQNGMYLLPKEGAWVHDYREEHSLFPDAGKHDDMVDTGSYAHHVMKNIAKLTSGASRYEEDTTMEGKVKRHQEQLDRKARRKNNRRSPLRGRIGM
jgi:predicted phage terminase large subunit-like protein